MEWKKLLSSKRLGKEKASAFSPGRSPFQQDFDRIVFSSAFRRLQDKAQVFPLAETDYVRTRLTHSMEVSCVGRSLGALAGEFICRNHDVGDVLPSDIGAIVAAASLSHDIGNPPLGHSGEEAIRYWFTRSEVARELAENDPRQYADIERFEGNAQGFRVLTRLQMPDNPGGMQLTCATLGAFAKYPLESKVSCPPKEKIYKKFNFFQADKELFREVAEETGLLRVSEDDYFWCRHPLVYLVEAADDICYHIVDFEDGFMLGIISYDELEKRFLQIIKDDNLKAKLKTIPTLERRVELLRARALGTLIKETAACFIKKHEPIMSGRLDKPLTSLIPSTGALSEIQQRSLEDIYTYRRAVEIEAAGFELTEGLLDVFVSCVNDLAANGGDASYRSRKLVQLIPEHFVPRDDPEWRESTYCRLLHVLDFISGMTDSYAVSLFKKIKGISLPGQ